MACNAGHFTFSGTKNYKKHIFFHIPFVDSKISYTFAPEIKEVP